MLFKLYNSLLSLLGNIFDQMKMQYIEVRALQSENLRYLLKELNTNDSLCGSFHLTMDAAFNTICTTQ